MQPYFKKGLHLQVYQLHIDFRFLDFLIKNVIRPKKPLNYSDILLKNKILK